MSGNNKERDEQMENLDKFAETAWQRLTGVLSNLGWTLQSMTENRLSYACPFNGGHRMREESFDHHLEKCGWKAEGYMADELPLSELCLSPDDWSAVKFGNIDDRLIPRTSDRLVASFSVSERKALYDRAIASTIKPDIGNDIADMNRLVQENGDDGKTSLLQLLAQERNLKRRRAKHRGVHTNKKSHVEILREVIAQQMEMYQEHLADVTTKQEPGSPGAPEQPRLDSCGGSGDEKYRGYETAEKYSTLRRSASSSVNDDRYFGRSNHARTTPPGPSSLKNDIRTDRVERRNKSEYRIKERERDRSKDRNKHEDERPERRRRKKDPRAEKEYQRFGDKYDRRKRRRSRDRSNKSVVKSRSHEKFDDDYFRYRKKIKNPKM